MSVSYILDPLTAAEIQQVVTLVQAATPIVIDGVNVLFAEITLVEADKRKVLEGIWQPRIARSLIYQNLGNHTFEYVINLTENTLVVTNRLLPGVIPPMNEANGLDNFPYMTSPNGQSGPYFRNMLNEPNNEAAAQFRASLEKRGITVDQVGSESNLPYYIGLGGFELFRKVKVHQSDCKEESSSSSSSCKCKCTTQITLGDEFRDGRYFPIALAPNNANALGSLLDGLTGFIDVSRINALGTPGVLIKTIDEYVVPPQEPSSPFPAPVLYTHKTLAPLKIVLPAGPSYTISGQLLTFDNWSMRLSWDPRTGLQFYQIQYFDSTQNKYRPILYKASVSDSMVCYNSAKPLSVYQGFISTDTDSYPMIPRMVNPVAGVDVPDWSTFIDIPYFNPDGSANLLSQMIAVYEEDGDIAWRSTNDLEGAWPGVQGIGTRGRCLIVRNIMSGAVYNWTFTWRFYQDGTIEPEVRLGGVIEIYQFWNNESTLSAKSKGYYGQIVAPMILAMQHTHIHCFRLDWQIDGVKNSVVQQDFTKICNKEEEPCEEKSQAECCSQAKPKKSSKSKHCSNHHKLINPAGIGLNHTADTLLTELGAVKNVKPGSYRWWTVTNPSVPSPAVPPDQHKDKSKINTTCGREDCSCKVGYAVLLSETATVEDTLPCSILNTHLGWALHNVHVTRYNSEEMYAAGNNWIQAKSDVGLAEWVKRDQDIVDKDVVMWVTMSIPHNPCPEDNPIIPPHVQKFRLSPCNFFINNPVLGIVAPNQIFFTTSC